MLLTKLTNFLEGCELGKKKSYHFREGDIYGQRLNP